jgi:hypothetical protein
MDANGVSASWTTTDCYAGWIATESWDVLLHKLEEELLVKQSKIQEAETLEYRMGQEAKRVELVGWASVLLDGYGTVLRGSWN